MTVLIIILFLCISALVFLVENLAGTLKELAASCLRLNDRIYELEKYALAHMRSGVESAQKVIDEHE